MENFRLKPLNLGELTWIRKVYIPDQVNYLVYSTKKMHKIWFKIYERMTAIQISVFQNVPLNRCRFFSLMLWILRAPDNRKINHNSTMVKLTFNAGGFWTRRKRFERSKQLSFRFYFIWQTFSPKLHWCWS